MKNFIKKSKEIIISSISLLLAGAHVLDNKPTSAIIWMFVSLIFGIIGWVEYSDNKKSKENESNRVKNDNKIS